MKSTIAITLVSCLCWPGILPADDKADSKDDVMIVGQIVPNDVPDKRRQHPCKIHALRLSKDKTYLIDLESKDFDSYLRIEDTAGKQLAEDDDGGEGLNARIRFVPPKDDTYQIIATTFGGGAGAYTLKVRAVGKAVVAKAIPLKLENNNLAKDFDGTLTKEDANDRVRNRPCKIHTVKFAKDKAYVIDLISKDFDSYLRLEDADGKQLAQDDDSGGFPNARIRFVAPADGEYRIIATTFGGGAGNYTLKIRGE
jgi:hypothetical protein